MTIIHIYGFTGLRELADRRHTLTRHFCYARIGRPLASHRDRVVGHQQRFDNRLTVRFKHQNHQVPFEARRAAGSTEYRILPAA